MKNIIKKVTAFAMAFTLLGAGTTVVKTISPKSDTTITASAVSAGVYTVNQNTSCYNLSRYINYAYRTLSYYKTIPAGTYFSCDGAEEMGPRPDGSNYYDIFVRVYYNGGYHWVLKSQVIRVH